VSQIIRAPAAVFGWVRCIDVSVYLSAHYEFTLCVVFALWNSGTLSQAFLVVLVCSLYLLT